ncbi:MAG: fibronectin type III domain-containing protein [Cyclobacteriaceae bacterium]|nr:fibronectin type III domain-containing protein [Cyclobacteriaceae bacterium]
MEWQPEDGKMYVVAHRKASDDTDFHYSTDTVRGPKLLIRGLMPGTTYEVKLAKQLEDKTYGSYSGTQTFRTFDYEAYDCQSGPTSFEPPANIQPLLLLVPGDVVQVADFEMVVVQASGQHGKFSGLGTIYVPWLGPRLAVTFQNIGINTDKQLISGEINFVQEVSVDELIGKLPEPAAVDAAIVLTFAVNDASQMVVSIDGDQVTIHGPNDRIVSYKVPGAANGFTIADSKGNVYLATPGDDGKRVKVEKVVPEINGSPLPGANQPVSSSSPLKEKLVIELSQELLAEIDDWMNLNGKGPLDEAELNRALALPSLWGTNEETLSLIKSETLPSIINKPAERLAILERDTVAKKILGDLTKSLSPGNTVKSQMDDDAWQKAKDLLSASISKNLGCTLQMPVPLDSMINANGAEHGYILPTDVAVRINEPEKLGFSNNGELRSFTINSIKFVAVRDSYGYFHGFVDSNDFRREGLGGSILSIEALGQIQAKRYALTELNAGQMVYTRARELISFDHYAQCVCAYQWEYTPTYGSMYGKAIFSTVPLSASKNRFDCQGPECGGTPGLMTGVGESLYLYITRKKDLPDDKKGALVLLANFLSEETGGLSYVFYGHGLEMFGNNPDNLHQDILKFFLDNSIYDRAKFDEHFKFKLSTRDKDVVFSTMDLWEGIDKDNYNKNSRDYTKGEGARYHYSFADLKGRQDHTNSPYFHLILKAEKAGLAEPLNTSTFYDQYLAKWKTDAAYIFISYWSAVWSKDILEANTAQYVATSGVLSTKALKDAAIGSLVDFTLQIGLNWAFFADENATINDIIAQVDYYQVAASGVENSFASAFGSDRAQLLVSAGASCLFDGLTENGDLRKDFDIGECSKGIASAVIALKISNFALARLKNLEPDKLRRGLERLGIDQGDWKGTLNWLGIKNADEVMQGAGKSLDDLLLSLKRKGNIQDESWDQFLADFGNDVSLLRRFDNNPGLVEAWKKMDNLGADEALRRNPGALEALSKPKGSRPDPSDYLSQKYIDDHLAKFDDGGSRIVSKNAYDEYGIGKPDNGKTEFIATKSEVDEILKLPIEQQAEKLGIPIDQLQNGGIVRVDFKPTDKIEIPSGNEFGANDQWIPGGKTDGGTLEAIVKTEGMTLDVDYTVIVL